MKTSTRTLFTSVALAAGLLLALASPAQEASPAPAASSPAAVDEKSPPPSVTAAAPSTPAVPVEPAKPAMPAAPTPPVEPAAAGNEETPTPATAAESPKAPELRRLDVVTPAPDSRPARAARERSRPGDRAPIVNVFANSYLPKGQRAEAVVSVFGSATSDGEVMDSVVSVFGNTRTTAPVGETVVAVFGNTYVDGPVGDKVVAVFGNVHLGPHAEVGGEVVCVFGKVTQDAKAIIHGGIANPLDGTLTEMEWARSWFVNCFLHGRLLAFGPHLMWAWWIALGFLALYVLFALLFGKGLALCTDTLEQRPGYSILAAVLTALLVPVVMILLVFTGVGIAVIPFLAIGLFVAGLFGKAVILAWIGRRITRLGGIDHPALAVLVGGVIVLGLYTVPILGLVVYKLLGWVGMGVVMYTLLLRMKREKPAVPPSPAPMGAATLVPAVIDTTATEVPPVMSAVTLPRAGFWIRVAALLLDVILIGVVMALVHSAGKLELLLLALYGACMWKLRGSTIGGIIFGLKVVRLDDRPLDWSTSIVRALGCFLSFIVLGLGFIWVAFDDQKQSWHDKIAGTTVVRVPKGVSLV